MASFLSQTPRGVLFHVSRIGQSRPLVHRYVTMKSWSVAGCLELSSYRKCSASLRPPVEGVRCLSPHQPRTIKITRVSPAFSAHRAWQVITVPCPTHPSPISQNPVTDFRRTILLYLIFSIKILLYTVSGNGTCTTRMQKREHFYRLSFV